MLRRISLIKWLAMLMFLAILCRLSYIQLYDGPHSGRGLAEKAAKRSVMTFNIEEYSRGEIYDRNGQSLTDSRISSRLVILPWLLPKADEVLMEKLRSKLAVIAKSDPLDAAAVKEFWEAVETGYAIGKTKENQPIIVYRLDQGKLLRTVEQAQIAGLAVLPVKGRYGPASLASHLVGYVRKADQVGVAGLEKKYDTWLQGSQSEYQLPSVKDVSGQPLPSILETKPQNTIDPQRCHVLTTLDSGLQQYTEQTMDQWLNKGAVVVLDVSKGDILATASRPDFDQNRISEYLEQGDALINRALRPEFFPGSVFKVVTAAAALEAGVVEARSSYDCQGSFEFNDQVSISCLRPHGSVDFKQALAVSCNGYFMSLADELGPQALGSMARRFGLNCQLGQYSNRILNANTAIGQQGIKVSALQMARVYACLARGGLDIEPRQVISVVNQQGQEIISQGPGKAFRILDKTVTDQLTDSLENAARIGTANQGWIPDAGTAGKTGTAQANDQGRVIAWYCGYTPAEKPRYVIVVMVEENNAGHNKGLQGGQEAAAIFKAVGKYCLDNLS